MTSPLLKAVAEGDLNGVLAILQSAQSVDIELADPSGNTPLIEAVQKGHVEIVRALLDNGADPNHTANRNTPLISLTSDPAIQELVNNAIQSRSYGTHAQGQPVAQDQVYPHEGANEPPKAYYPLPGAYYYPGPPPPFPDGAMPYYPPHLSGDPSIGNLPPPEIARMIPCRYFPACRYGSSCMFAHPTSATGYGHMPIPTHYPHHYDPMNAPPYPPQNYYPGSPPFQPPIHPVNMTSPHNPPQAPPMHTRTSSDSVTSPGANYPGPGPVNYGPVPAGPYPPHPGQAPVMGPIPPQHQVPPPGQQGPPQPYPTGAQQGPVPPFPVPSDTGYPPQIPADGSLPQNPPPSHPGEEGYIGGHIPPSGPGYRRPGLRKNSYASKKPACLFFPSGRCRNGNDCRFPHILPENNGFGPGRMGSKPRYPLNGVTNNVTNLEEKFSRMNVQEQDENRTHPSTGHSSRSHSSERRKQFGHQNGFHANGKKQHATKASQRVPTFDEFPTLNGTSATNNSPKASGPNGLTAAQVLQAPAPFRPKEGSRIPSPEQNPNGDTSKLTKATTEVNEKHPNVTPPVEKIPLSFAAVTTNGVNGAVKEVSVGA